MSSFQFNTHVVGLKVRQPATLLAQFILLATFISLSLPLAAQDCQRRMLGTSDNDFGYKARGNRCEGLFAQQVSGSINLSLVGYHAGTPAYNIQAQDSVT